MFFLQCFICKGTTSISNKSDDESESKRPREERNIIIRKSVQVLGVRQNHLHFHLSFLRSLNLQLDLPAETSTAQSETNKDFEKLNVLREDIRTLRNQFSYGKLLGISC